MTMNLSQVKINKWMLHFFFINLLIVYALSYNYIMGAFSIRLYSFETHGFVEATNFTRLLVSLYLIITYISYFSLLTILTLAIPYVLSKIASQNWLVIGLSIFCISCFILLIIIDLYVFMLYRFHLSSMILKMIFSPYSSQIFYFSTKEWRIFYLFIALILGVESLLALLLWVNPRINFSKWIIRFICASIILAIISFCSTVLGGQYFIRQSTIFPYYTDIIRYLCSVSKEDMNNYVNSHYFGQSQFATHQLNYPIKPLQCHKKQSPPNIFVILIDTWRFDAMTKEITPYLFNFAKENLYFSQHYSGGNATQPGVFSLFYSMPASYWTTIFEQKKGPELFNQLVNNDYQFGIFASASLHVPDFESTIFNKIPNIEEAPTGWAYQRDAITTQRFLSFLANHKSNQPLFSFIFYDSAHEYCGERNYKGPFQPEIKLCARYLLNDSYNAKYFKNRYLNSVNFVDQQVAQVLEGIKKSHLLENSIIIISGDHGEEFNDNNQNYWGHASNFSKYQIAVPLIVHWPGIPTHQYNYVTTHYDIVPTLLTEALGCKTPYADYSYGTNLFNSQNRFPIIVSGNYNLSYITPETITNLFPSGDFEIQNSKMESLKHNLDNKQLMSILQRANRFYH